AHIFICMLAYHLQWHLTEALKPLLFEDEITGGAPRSSPVAKARRSEAAETKAARKLSQDGLCVHSFKTLLCELSTLCRVTIRPDIKNADAFFKLTEPTEIQKKAYSLLGFNPQIMPCSQ
ncbi:MAG: IS1634 family transposase, partial [Opitutales bacterium]